MTRTWMVALAVMCLGSASVASPPSPVTPSSVAPSPSPVTPSSVAPSPSSPSLGPGQQPGNTVCGDGRRGISAYTMVCASCVPGAPCPCGQVPVEEECDGQDLASQSCESRGFLSGQLRCSARCTLDESGCSPLARNGPFARAALRDKPVGGRDFALARSGSQLGIASSETGVVRFARFDAVTLAKQAESEWRSPPNYPPGATGLSRFENVTHDPYWSPALVAIGGGFVLAVERAAYTAYTVITFRIGADGQLGEPVASTPGIHPLFLVAGKSDALLAYGRTGLQLLRVRADGTFVGEPVPLPEPARDLGTVASALFIGDTWWVATGPKEPNDRDQQVRLTRVGADGRVLGTPLVVGEGSTFSLFRDGTGVALALATPSGIQTVRVPASGPPSHGTGFASTDKLLVAEGDPTHPVLWTWNYGVLHRASGEHTSDAVRTKGLEPLATLAADGTFFLLFKDTTAGLVPPVTLYQSAL